MSWTKADKQKFLDSCELAQEFMPREVIVKQKSLFEDVIETEFLPGQKKYQKIRLVLKYPPLDKNPDGDPIPKQSARFVPMRYFQGPNKGDVVVYPNKYTGKKDITLKSYQTPIITNTSAMLQKQILKQLKEQQAYKFRECIFITRMEFIFKHNKNAPQYMLTDLRAGNKIYFKDTKPDLDNLEKLVWDAMQTQKVSEKKGNKSLEEHENDIKDAMRGLVYDNDAQIVAKNAVFKRWGIIPGAIIEMEGYV